MINGCLQNDFRIVSKSNVPSDFNFKQEKGEKIFKYFFMEENLNL